MTLRRRMICMNCRRDGPALTTDTDRRLPRRHYLNVEFTCGKCGSSWRWRKRYGFLYELVTS